MLGVGGRWGVVAAAGLLACFGCASTQTVALHCVPHDVTVYVDGRKLEKTPESIELSRDEHHKIFFKGGGYEPRMVVLESREVDGEARLEPADLCTETAFVEMAPEVELHVDEPDEDDPGS